MGFLLGTMIVVPAVALLVLRSWLPPLAARPSPATTSLASRTAPKAEDRTPEIRGRVLSQDGDPVGGATVRVVTARPPLLSLHETKSDSAGSFSFPHLDSGAVRLLADHDPDGIASSGVVDVTFGTDTELTLVLSAAGAIVGTLVDEEDHPVGGGALSVLGVPWTVSGATSDENGAFRLSAIPREATTLVATARGYETARVALGPRGEGSEFVVRVRLRATPAPEGDVLDPDGQPATARVVACEGQPFEARTSSAKDGTFRLPATAAGCEVVARSDDDDESERGVLVQGRRTVLRLRPGGAIEGVVADDRGSGIPSFSVGIEAFSAANGRSFRSVPARSFEDSRGSFRLGKLAPGTYVLTATAPGKPPTRSASIDVRGGSATTGVRIVLADGGSIVGQVYDDRHAPIAGADLRFDSASSVAPSDAVAKSDDSGRYRLDGAPSGLFTLRVQKDGFRLRMVSGLRVASRGTLKQDVLLTPISGGAGLELTGIGANIQQTGSGIVLGEVFAGDPAAHAGLQKGDVVLGIDGENTDGMSPADVVQRLRGELGSVVGVTVQRPGTGETVDAIIERGRILR